MSLSYHKNIQNSIKFCLISLCLIISSHKRLRPQSHTGWHRGHADPLYRTGKFQSAANSLFYFLQSPVRPGLQLFGSAILCAKRKEIVLKLFCNSTRISICNKDAFSHKASPQLSCYRRIKVPDHYHPNKSLFPVGFFAFLGIRQTIAFYIRVITLF